MNTTKEEVMAERPKTRHVVIAYSLDRDRVGTTQELDTEEAAGLVDEGRARYATDEEIRAAKGGGNTTPADAEQAGNAKAAAAKAAGNRSL